MPSSRHLLIPTISSGVLVAAYLVLRPYGDSHSGDLMAEAFASPWWVIAHVCGALGLAACAWLALRLADTDGSRLARVARATGLAGAMLVLPYYGAEAFGLHAVGTRAGESNLAWLDVVSQIRYQPVAVSMFGAGLLLLAAAGIVLAVVWSRQGGEALRWAAWPLGALMAFFLPQFFLPGAGRILYGFAYLAAAGLFATACMRRGSSETASSPQAMRPARRSRGHGATGPEDSRRQSVNTSLIDPPGSPSPADQALIHECTISLGLVGAGQPFELARAYGLAQLQQL